MATLMQRSFAGGEIAPALYGRADQSRYQYGARTLLNWLIRREGAATNRAGFQYIAEVKDSSKPPALFKFVFNSEQTYLIEAGDGYMRFFSDGAPVTAPEDTEEWSGTEAIPGTVSTITGIADFTPGIEFEVTTALAHGLVDGDTVVIAGVVGTTEANGRFVVNVTAATTFIILGVFVNPWVSGGTVELDGHQIFAATDDGSGRYLITTVNPHGLVTGDPVRIRDFTTDPGTNGDYIAIVTGASSFVLLASTWIADSTGLESGSFILREERTYEPGDLTQLDGIFYLCLLTITGLSEPFTSPDYWEVLPDGVYQINTPYAQADLLGLRYAQSADVITIVHPNYEPRELQRYDHTDWRLTEISTIPAVNSPANVAVTPGLPAAGIATPTGLTASGSAWNIGQPGAYYKVTAWKNSPPAESAVSGASNLKLSAFIDPVTLTWNAVAGADGYIVYKNADDTPPSTSGPYYIVYTGPGLSYVDNGDTLGIAVRATPSGLGSGTLFSYKVTAIDDATGVESLPSDVATGEGGTPTALNPNQIGWDSVSGASRYNIYKANNDIYGFIGQASGNTFNDDNITPSSVQPPTSNPPFESADNYPSTVAYFQQRLFSGGTINNPEKFWATSIGDYHNYVSSTPIADDDALAFTISDGQVNAIRALIPLRKMVILTAGGEHVLGGNADGAITPLSPNLTQQGTRGSAEIKPLVIGDTAIYIQAQGTIVRDLRYDYQSDGYNGKDITVFATHLFYNHTIVDWDFAENPHSIVWAAREDGVLLGCTYIREQDVVAWHRHTTGDGDTFERVCTVPEDNENAVYAVICRTVDGNTVRYIERMRSRQVTDVAVDAFFVDSGLTYDGRNTGDTTFAITADADLWDLDIGTFSLIASAATFAGDSSDIGKVYAVTYGEDVIRCTVVASVSTTAVTVGLSEIPPQYLQDGNSVTTWALMATTFSGLDHLEGRTVAALGDGSDLGTYVVDGGEIALEIPCSVVHAGLPIVADLETLDLENLAAETIAHKRKIINEVTILLEDTRGIEAGSNEDLLEDALLRKLEAMDDPLEPYTGKAQFHLKATWDDNGRTLIRQSAPLPATVLAIAATGFVGQ
jgi:hypothetical protein